MGAAARQITAAAIASFDACPNPRTRELLQSLTAHLHELIAEMRLTRGEWERGIEILTQTGEITDEHRQEFILWSDALGISMLVDALADERPAEATDSTVEGPFWAEGSPLREYGESIAEQPGGEPLWVSGRVLAVGGEPLARAEVDVWQNGTNRLYAVQNPDSPEEHLRGRFVTRDDGSFAFLAIRPTPYPIPDDGPVGQMLASTGRHPWRPAHIHVAVSAGGFERLTTHVFDSASPYLDSDAVFAVKPSLIKHLVRHDPNDPSRPSGVDGEWSSLEVNFVLAPTRMVTAE
jgi:hydroxyquinol 1,2-dioxygenase